MRVSSTASPKRSGSPAKPGASTSIAQGMATSTASTKASSTASSTACTSAAKSSAALRPSASRLPANSGTKATVRAPSPVSRRKKFGSLKATQNASATGPAPRIAASRMSRTKPVTRLTRVKPPPVAMARVRDMRRKPVDTDTECTRAEGRRGHGLPRRSPVADDRGGNAAPSRRLAGFGGPERRHQRPAYVLELALAVDLQAEHVLQVEHVDEALAIGRDRRRVDLQIGRAHV